MKEFFNIMLKRKMYTPIECMLYGAGFGMACLGLGAMKEVYVWIGGGILAVSFLSVILRVRVERRKVK